ncbi:MAG TPA: hypothetical protein VMT03_26810 [Polyangia bacterium]|nr:hypothetical protein [Polyangia bacterium]
MGTWGVGLYQNDTACDVRDTWVEKLRQGAPAEAATAELLQEWGAPDDDPLFWLALADTQWTWGRLDREVRDGARRALAAGGDLDLWPQSKERAARKRVFDRLAAKLEQPPPAPRAIRVRGDVIDWKRGQLWAYRTLDGKYAVLRVCAFDPACGLVGAPVTELLDIVLDDLPPTGSLAQTGPKLARPNYNESGRYDFFDPQHRASPLFEPKVKRRGELPRRRLKKLRAQGEPRAALPTTKTIGVPWDTMDEFLPNMFDAGGPRLGAVHRWSLANGEIVYTVIERMRFPPTNYESEWQLGVLDCRGADLEARAIETANVCAWLIVFGFPPTGMLHEAGYRPPKTAVYRSGRVLRWDALPNALGELPLP